MKRTDRATDHGRGDGKDLEIGEALHESDEDREYPPFKVVLPSIISLYLVFFLAALDRTIVGVAVPAISNHFQSFGDISWYEAAFLLTSCIFQLPMGKIYKYLPAKWTLVVIAIIFEVGSIVCAAAPSSAAFIIGRAIAGIGAAGILTGSQVVIADLVPLSKRPQYQGFAGAMFGIASIVGPLVGGVLTTKVSWRWCFWINVPICGVALAGLLFVLPNSDPPVKSEGTFFDRVKTFDPIGNILLAPGLVCLLLALQWGGTKWSWSDHRIIVLLVVGCALLVAFAVVQCVVKENGTIPPRIISQRSIVAGTFATLGIGAPLIIVTFYLPIWQQAIKGVSASQAGVRMLAYFLSTVVFVILSGVAISKLGYYTPFLIAGTAITVVATGLLSTFRVNTETGEWVGYQILIGAGLGLSLQQPYNAAQAVLSRADIPVGVTIFAFCNNLAGATFVTIAQTVLSNTLSSQLSKELPDFDAASVGTTGATNIRSLVPKDKVDIVLRAYNKSIDNVFYCALGTACLAFIASLFFEWKSVLGKSGNGKAKERETAKDTKETQS